MLGIVITFLKDCVGGFGVGGRLGHTVDVIGLAGLSTGILHPAVGIFQIDLFAQLIGTIHNVF